MAIARKAKPGSARAAYERLQPDRDFFLRRAEMAAALTIPTLIPPAFTAAPSMDFPVPRQGVGARGVTHLAARLLLTLLPPTGPFFRLDMDKFTRDKLASDKQTETDVIATLKRIEDAVMRDINTHAHRVSAAEIFKHLIVSGNCMQYLQKSGGMGYFPLSSYVVARDCEGDEVVKIVIEEDVAFEALSPAMQQQVKNAMANQPKSSGDADADGDSCTDEICVYTDVCRKSEDLYEVHQELDDGSEIEGTRGTFTADQLPYRPLRWSKVHSEAYGRGLVEEVFGDLQALEHLSQALVEGALAASRVVGLVAPNGSTHPKDINDAKNGEFVRGRRDDITFLQLEKFADFRTCQETMVRIERRLESAFLLNGSVIRDAERVTAEEVRFTAQELESALGGVYSILAAEFQLPLVTTVMARLQRQRQIPGFGPLKKRIKPMIITGMDALGRSAELERLRVAFGVLREIVGPEAVAQYADIGPLMTYVFAQAGVDIEFVKTAAQIQQERQQAMQAQAMQEAISKGTGPAINAISAATQGASSPAAGPQ